MSRDVQGGADMRSVGLFVLGLAVSLGCARPSEPAHPPLLVGDATDDTPEATAEALLSAWFGCAMGELWTAALETPPYTWAAPSLARCHAVGKVVDAPAARLRAFVPDAVAAVSRSLQTKLSPTAGYGPVERAEALELFELGTAALRELSLSFETAKELGRPVDATDENALKPSAVQARLFRMSQVEALENLWRFGNEQTGLRAAQATALAWMITLQRVHKAKELAPELRTAHVAPALATVARIPPPEQALGALPSEGWGAYLARAAATLGAMPHPAARERELHAALVRTLAERLRAAAHPLPTGELRRATLGCAEAFLRDTEDVLTRR